MEIFAIIALVGLLWWLRLWAPNAGAPGLIPGQGPRSHMLQVIIHMKQPRSCIPQPRSYEAKIIINNNNMWLHILSQSKYTEIPRYRNFTGSVSWWYCNKTRNNHNVKEKINYLESLKHSPNSSRDKDRIKSVITKDF